MSTCCRAVTFNSLKDNIAMVPRNLCNLLVLSLVISCVFAIDDKEKTDESDKKDGKTVSKRGVHHYSTHGHVHPAVVSASHYHLPPAVPVIAKYPDIHKPHVHLPVAPVHVSTPIVPPHYHIVPGGASVTSYSVNYPRYPLLHRPAVPFYSKPIVPAFAPPVVASAPSAFIPTYPHHHHHDHVPAFHHHHQPAALTPHCHSQPITPTYLAPKPVIPVAVQFPGHHRHPKYPVFINHHKPVFTGVVPPQYIPFASPTPTFIPVAVPSNPQPVSPPSSVNPGTTAQGTNFNPITQEFPQQIPMPTQPTFVHQPTQPSITSHSWRPVMMTQHNHHSQTTQPTFTNKNPPYNYHAPAMAFNHDQTSSNDIISGHGQMSSQFAHQLALYQHQQHLQQQQQYIQQQQHQDSKLKQFLLLMITIG